MARWFVRLLVLSVVTGVAWAGWHAFAPATGFDIATTHLLKGPLSLTVSATGKLAPTNQVLVGCEVSGTVEQLGANYNDCVHQGQVIARIRPKYYQAQYDQAQAELAKATAQLDKLQVTYQEAQREWQRIASLRKTGAVTDLECDIKQTAVASAKAAVAMGKATVQAARSKVELAEYQLKRAVIVSPVDGVVLDRRVDVGQTVAATLQTPVLFVLAEDLSRMDLLADVSEADIGYICPGQPVTFTVNAYRDRTFQGRVRQVRNQPHSVGDVVSDTVVISVANKDGMFRPGMPADVTIQIVHQPKATKIVNAALRFRPPLPPDVIRSQIEQLTWPEPPAPLHVSGSASARLATATQHSALGTQHAARSTQHLTEPPPLDPAKGTLWQCIDGHWHPVPVWTLYTDNRETAVYTGPGINPDTDFVTEIARKGSGRSSLEQAFYLANPANRKL